MITLCLDIITTAAILFIVLGRYFGMAPGTFGCVFVSALGDRAAAHG